MKRSATMSRQQMRLAARTADKDSWREHRKERLLMHKLDRMRKIYQGRVERKEIEPHAQLPR